MANKIDKTKIAYSVLGILFIGVLFFFSHSRVFDEFEYSTFDLRYRLRPANMGERNIVIVEVGDDSISKLGQWPFSRIYHALLIKALNSSGAETIVFDIFFSEKKEGDDALAEAVSEAGNVYLPYVFDLNRSRGGRDHVHADGYAAQLIDKLKNVAGEKIGFINIEPDIDGKVRRIPPVVEYDNVLYPQITVLAALNKLGYKFSEIRTKFADKIVLGQDHIIPLDYDSSLLVNYPAVWGKAFRYYSYVDILQSYLSDMTGQEPILDLKEFEGAVCFVGLTATASPDAHPSPMEPLYPGVGVHASIYNGILSSDYLVRLNKWWNLFILVAMWFIVGVVTQKSRKRFALLSIVLIISIYILVSAVIFWSTGIWVDVFYPLITMVVIYVIIAFKKYVTETQKRELIEKELDIAKDIQLSFLPKEMPNLGKIDIAVKMLTARQVGGDLYDVVQLDENEIGIMLGDVSGKGVPAALYMARVVSVFKASYKEKSPKVVLKNMNDRLVAESNSGLFVTLTYMTFNVKTNSGRFAIGGHMPTILIEPDGNVEMLDVEEGMPLGMIESDFSERVYEYRPGSMFIFYTDGVTEAMNVKEEMFEEDRLVELAGRLKDMSARDAVDTIHKAVSDFAGKAKQHDDITVLVVKV